MSSKKTCISLLRHLLLPLLVAVMAGTMLLFLEYKTNIFSKPTEIPDPEPTPTRERIATATIFVPTDTPVPLPAVKGELLFEDHFNDNRNRWILTNQDDYSIADSFYHMSLSQGESCSVYSEDYLDELRSFVYEAAFREVGTSGAYSISFRAHYPGRGAWYQRYYSFEVIPRQQVYNVERVDFTASNTGSDWPAPLMWRGYVPLIDWQETNHTLTVVARENQFSFYIDDRFISTLVDEDDLYRQGTIGFGAGDAHIAVDYVRVWALRQ